jgi:hypothetical protein
MRSGTPHKANGGQPIAVAAARLAKPSGCGLCFRPVGATYVGRHAECSPDPAPAVAMRTCLAQLRASGVPFPQAWPAAMEAALEVARETCPADNDFSQWRVAFRWTRHSWREA